MAGRIVVQWDKDALEEAGLVKIDLLGLRMLAVLSETEQLLAEAGTPVDLDRLTFDDPAIYQMLAQAVHFGFRLGEVSCPTRYMPEASSINFRRSCVYGLGVLATGVAFRLNALGLRASPIFSESGRRLSAGGVGERGSIAGRTRP